MELKIYKKTLNSTFLVVLIIVYSYFVIALPVGPTITLVQNQTGTNMPSTLVNTTGGSITTMVLDTTAQNLKWKAYVGNVTGRFVLDDLNDYSLYNWEMASIVGEVYATRASNVVSWFNVRCSNSTNINSEEVALNHTINPNDNITTTFSTKLHRSFYAGTVQITNNSCFSIHTNVNNQTQTTSFEEIILYDGGESLTGNNVYATPIEQSINGYNNQKYDFQMIVPEVALPTWTSSTAYYFYVELT